MRTLPSPDLSPRSCVEADSADARVLDFLPFAVRFKLDGCGLRMSLAGWQRLPLEHRGALVRASLEAGAAGFRALAVAAGATADARQRAAHAALDDEDLRALYGNDVELWLACATPFAKYVARKIASRECRETA